MTRQRLPRFAPAPGGPSAPAHDASARRRGGLLRDWNFRLLWVGETISSTGNAMAVVGLPLLAVTVLHASTFMVSELTAAAYLPWLLIGLPAGTWVDRLPTRPLMIVCDVLSALLYGSLPVLSLTRALSAAALVLVALLAGAVNVLFSTAYQSLLAALVSPGELAEGNARLQGSAQVAAIAGRSTAGLAAEAVGAASALLFNAASFLVSAACLQCIRVARKPARSGRDAGIWAATVEGIRFVVSDPFLRPLALSAAIGNLAYTGNLALVVIFLVRVIGLSPAAVGILIAAAGLGGVLGAMVAGWLARTFGSARALVAATLVSGLSGLLIPLSGQGPRMAFFVVGSATVAAGIAIGNVIVSSFRQAYCPPSMLGRVTTSMRFPVYGAIPLGALLAGALGTALGTRNGLWVVLAVFAASGTLLLTRDIRSVRDLPGGR